MATILPTTTPGLVPTPDIDAEEVGSTGTDHGRSSVGSMAVSFSCTPCTLTLQRPTFNGSFLFSTIPVYIYILLVSQLC